MLLEHGPAKLHLVLASRVAPPLSLGRLRVAAQVFELDAAGLPFEPAETRSFLELNLAALKLGPDEVQLIHELIHGWPASLQLVAMMLPARPDARGALRDLARKSDDLQAYLSETVLAHLPTDLTVFMEGISLCRRFNAPLAQAITGSTVAAEMLARLEDEKLLVYRVESDDPVPYYRFHPLFAEFLATRLARRDPVELAALHRRAAHWFDEHQLLAEAVRHAVQGGDVEFAAAAIERSAPATWSPQALMQTLRLLDRLPAEALYARPRLFVLGCLSYAMGGRWAKAEAWFEQFQRSSGPHDAAVTARLPAIQAAIELQRDRTEKVIELLEGYRPLADDYSFMGLAPPALLAIAYAAEGRFADAHRRLDELAFADADADADASDEMSLLAAGARPLCLLLAGRVKDAARAGDAQLARAVARHGPRSISAGLAATTLADVYWELDRIDEARVLLADRDPVLQWSTPDAMWRGSVCRARLDLLHGSAEAALAFLQRQERHLSHLGQNRAVAHVVGEQVRIALLADDSDTAAAAAARLETLAAPYADARGFRAEIASTAALARARLMLAVWRPEQALQALERVRRKR